MAVVVRLRWLGPVAGVGGSVSQFPSAGSCGCCPSCPLAGGLSILVGWLFAFVHSWHLLLLAPATPGWSVHSGGVERAPPKVCSGNLLLACG